MRLLTLATTLAITILCSAFTTPTAWPSKIEIVSINSNGEQANGQSGAGTLSANGRFVAFISWADNLVENDTNGGGLKFFY